MKRIVSYSIVVGLMVLVPFLTQNPVYAKEKTESPANQIRNYAERVIGTLKDPSLTTKENLPKLRQKLFNQFTTIADFRLMTRSALGPRARQISQQQLDKLTNVFRPLVLRLYTDRLIQNIIKIEDSWSVEGISVKDQDIRPGGQFAEVNGIIHAHRKNKQRDVPVTFRMNKQKDGWKAYDLILENFSLVENYRSQFRSVLANHSFGHLVNQLQTKLKKARAD